MTSEPDPDFATVIELERRLLDPAVRRDVEALVALLREDFREFGASGRVYDRAAIVHELLSAPGGSVGASDFVAARLGPDAVLLTYRTDPPSLRTSVWLRDDDGSWRMLHHQGTSVP